MRSSRVIPSAFERESPAVLHIQEGKVLGIYPIHRTVEGLPLIDAGDSVIMPGIVDTHAHINEPGRTEWEGFETATRAAAAGGITTVVDMPLNSIPATTSLSALQTKQKILDKKIWIDIGLWGGVVPGNLDELSSMVHAGALGFKAFLIDSGVEEFPPVDKPYLFQAMERLAHYKVPLLVHAECEAALPNPSPANDPRQYSTYLASRPEDWEVEAIRILVEGVKKTGCPVHIVHLSAASAIPLLAQARADGLPITVETCPHYLTLTSETISTGATQFKCAPPIREERNRIDLWKALVHGHIDMIVSDHSPCTPALKGMERGDFLKAWGGIASLQFSLPLVWTEMKDHGLDRTSLVRWMSANPAKLAGLQHRKGSLLPGMDADITVWDPESPFVVEPSSILHRHPICPYIGKTLYGVVRQTWVRGNSVFDNGHFLSEAKGELLVRS